MMEAFPGDLIYSCFSLNPKSGYKNRLPPALMMGHEEIRYEGPWRAITQTSLLFFFPINLRQIHPVT